jgi:4-carboxymuconolactone decarboxylase
MSTEAARRFGPLPNDSMTPEQTKIVDQVLNGQLLGGTGRTEIGGPFDAMLRSPAVADMSRRIGEHIRFGAGVPQALLELAILVTARRWNTQFEWHAHYLRAIAEGVDTAVIDTIGNGGVPELDADQRVVYDFTTQLLADGTVTDDAFEAVASRWGKVGAMDLIATIGYYCLLSFTLNVDRYPVPPGGHELPQL